jgi:hypothetical protein
MIFLQNVYRDRYRINRSVYGITESHWYYKDKIIKL